MAKKSKAKIAAIRQALQELEDQGRLVPAAVVEAAADPGSVLHDQFEWNDSIAAQKFRLTQAEGLIRRVRIQIRHHRVRYVIPGYVRDTTTTEAGMISLTAGDFSRIDAENSVEAELARLRGNIVRSRGVVCALDQKYPAWGL